MLAQLATMRACSFVGAQLRKTLCARRVQLALLGSTLCRLAVPRKTQCARLAVSAPPAVVCCLPALQMLIRSVKPARSAMQTASSSPRVRMTPILSAKRVPSARLDNFSSLHARQAKTLCARLALSVPQAVALFPRVPPITTSSAKRAKSAPPMSFWFQPVRMTPILSAKHVLCARLVNSSSPRARQTRMLCARLALSALQALA